MNEKPVKKRQTAWREGLQVRKHEIPRGQILKRPAAVTKAL